MKYDTVLHAIERSVSHNEIVHLTPYYRAEVIDEIHSLPGVENLGGVLNEDIDEIWGEYKGSPFRLHLHA